MIYRRTFDAAGHDSLAKLARWIAAGSRVLELGAAAGYFTAHLRERGCSVDVIELDAKAAREAAAHASRTIVADLDGDAWLADVCDARYDAVVCADVLEHLRDGRRLLERLRPLVAEGGALLLSVPNVAHSAVIANLVGERFDYGGEGLLDPTHLRLYTWRSLADTLAAAGYAIVEWDATSVELFDTEFRVRAEALAPSLRDSLAQRPHANVYQWLVRAVPGAVAVQSAPPDGERAAQSVPVRLLHARSADELTLDRAIVARLPIGAQACELDWPIPAPANALRLLLADRIGVVRLAQVRLVAGDETIWAADGPGDLELSSSAVPIGAHALALVAPDAWIAPRVAPAVAARAERMTATLGWPSSFGGDDSFGLFEAMAAALRREIEAATRSRDELVSRIEALERRRHEDERERADARAALAEARNGLARRSADVASLERSVEAYRAENARLDAALAAQDRIIAYRQSLRWWLKLPLVRVKWWLHRTIGR